MNRTAKLTVEQTKQLISLVEPEEYIWNDKDPNFTNRDKRSAFFQSARDSLDFVGTGE